MCHHNPHCYYWPGHAHWIKKRPAKPKRSRQSTRAYRTKLQDALLRSSTTNTLLKRANDVIPSSLLHLDPSDKLSNHPSLIRDIVARSLYHDYHAGKPKDVAKDQPIWQALLSILESELPKDDAPEAIWSTEENFAFQKPGQLVSGQENVITDPIWKRFPDVASTRKLLADAFISHAVSTKAVDAMEVLAKYDADFEYAPDGQGYRSALDYPYFESPLTERLRRERGISHKLGPEAKFRVAFGFAPTLEDLKL
ncbi:hypothetical protein QBC40DRAFT_286028 [Triangularia verruculosa]|uniref:Uncharacterized protein n=1 Tax=Triangularia verruculosa TaxID=2587418 RepID=A0AAN6XCY2_9PEZI|nr:hypothetical protein QBC40DRAFT_286028 [Triangularia verruculosa]